METMNIKRKRIINFATILPIAVFAIILFTNCSNEYEQEEEDMYTLSNRLLTRAIEGEIGREVIIAGNKDFSEPVRGSDVVINFHLSWNECDPAAFYGYVTHDECILDPSTYSFGNIQTSSPSIHNGQIVFHYSTTLYIHTWIPVSENGVITYYEHIDHQAIKGDLYTSYETKYIEY